jgi:hypothetical protein
MSFKERLGLLTRFMTLIIAIANGLVEEDGDKALLQIKLYLLQINMRLQTSFIFIKALQNYIFWKFNKVKRYSFF